MRRSLIVAGLVLGFCLQGIEAEAKPRHWYSDWKWWGGEAVIVTAAGLDGKTSCDVYKRGYVEGNLINRGNTSCGEAAGILFGDAAFYTALHLLNHKYLVGSDKRWVNIVGRAGVPGAVAAIHAQAIELNLSHD
jgi:hypothetical protein